MTINSIEYITKKHFHSLINLLVTLIALAIAALACCLSYFSAFSPVWTAIAAFTCFSALSALVRVFAPGKGCSLLRLSISITYILQVMIVDNEEELAEIDDKELLMALDDLFRERFGEIYGNAQELSSPDE